VGMITGKDARRVEARVGVGQTPSRSIIEPARESMRALANTSLDDFAGSWYTSLRAIF